MEKVENQNNTSINQNQDSGEDSEKTDKNFDTKNKHETDKVPKEDIKEYTPEEKITELEEVVITPDNQDKFLDLKEEEFKGYDYVFDKSTKVVNTLTDDRQFTDGLNIVNIAKLISSIIGGKNQVEKEKLKASEVLPYVFADDFFINDLNLRQDQILGFLIYVDSKLPSQKLLQVSQQFQLIDFLIIESNNYKNQL